MTPLLRWVFLALLLASAACINVYPDDDACVRLCRAQKRRPETNEFCNHQRSAAQSNRDRSPLQRLLRICLTPCRDPGTPDRLYFENSASCLFVRDTLISAKRCSCQDDDSPVDPLGKDPQFERMLENIEVYFGAGDLDRNVAPIMLNKILNTGTTVSSVVQEDRKATDTTTTTKQPTTQHQTTKQPTTQPQTTKQPTTQQQTTKQPTTQQQTTKEATTTTVQRQVESKTTATVTMTTKEVTTPSTTTSSTTTTTTTTTTSEEPPVDWDMWCMAQCDVGQGGSACHCDIIP